MTDWKEECLKKAKFEREHYYCSRDSLIDELYEKNDEIERLNKENDILKEALLFIWKDYKKDTIDIDELEKALKQLKEGK